MNMQFVETIRYHRYKLWNIELHKQRFEKTVKDFSLGLDADVFNQIHIPKNYLDDEVKVRLLYTHNDYSLEFSPYKRRRIERLRLIESDIEYSYKSQDRSDIEALFSQRGVCDDIIITKDGYLRDSSISNLVFKDHSNRLFTPSTPLLKGVQRHRLIQDGLIQEAPIHISDLHKYHSLHLINAMNDLNDIDPIPIASIVF